MNVQVTFPGFCSVDRVGRRNMPNHVFLHQGNVDLLIMMYDVNVESLDIQGGYFRGQFF